MSKLTMAATIGVASLVAIYVASDHVFARGSEAGSVKAGAPAGTTERGFVIHTQESAPAETKEVLGWYREHLEFVPHLAGIMADSPALIRSYWQLQENLKQHGSLTPAEDNVIQLAIAVENRCQYCVAGHSMVAGSYFGNTEQELHALRTRSKLPQAKLDALRTFAIAVHERQGRVTERQLRAFYEAGYSRRQALDVVANIAAKVMSNYANQIALTPIDEPMKPFAEGLPFKEERRLVRP